MESQQFVVSLGQGSSDQDSGGEKEEKKSTPGFEIPLVIAGTAAVAIILGWKRE